MFPRSNKANGNGLFYNPIDVFTRAAEPKHLFQTPAPYLNIKALAPNFPNTVFIHCKNDQHWKFIAETYKNRIPKGDFQKNRCPIPNL